MHVRCAIDIPLGVVATSLRCETQEPVLVVEFLTRLRCLSLLLSWGGLSGLVLLAIFSCETLLEVGDEAMEGLVELVEERHAAALGRGPGLLLGVLQRVLLDACSCTQRVGEVGLKHRMRAKRKTR
jgi:hypothetical protein